ncbi:MAG: ATP-binding cassette domain-containing protein [Rubrobacteraceae bacterium]
MARREAGWDEGGEPAIEVEDLVVRYGRQKAVDGLSISVPRGSVYAFLGPNGAGKTTTIKTLMGFRGSDGGQARVLGHDVAEESLQVRARVGYVGETRSLYGYMTARGHGKLCRSLGTRWDQGLFERKLELFRIPPGVKARKLSKGQKAQLELCLALGGDPELLILDEPASGLDPAARQKLLKVIVDLAAEERTVFFSTHVLSDVEAVADMAGIIESGRLVVGDEIDCLRETHKVFRLVYAEEPPDEELRLLRYLPDVLDVEKEGRGVRLQIRGEAEAVRKILEERPYRLLDVDCGGMSLEEIFLRYVEADDDR